MENLTHHIEDEYDNWYPDYPYSRSIKSTLENQSKESSEGVDMLYLSESKQPD
jgi:hypothetical protein